MAKTTAEALREAGVNIGRATLHMIEPEALTLVKDPEHSLFDPRVNDPIDTSSTYYRDVHARGVEVPVEVRRNGVDPVTNRPILQVVDGRQRVKCAVLSNLELIAAGQQPRRIPVIFVHGSDRDMVLRSLAGNLLRRDETPFTKAVKMDKARRAGATPEEISRACNCTIASVDEHLLILNFVPEVQQAFNGELPAGVISTFANVPRESQPKALADLRASGAKGTRQVAAAVKASQRGEQYQPPAKRPRRMAQAQLEKLSQEIDRIALTGVTGSAGASAMLRFLLGDTEALKSFPVLHQAVLSVVGTKGAKRRDGTREKAA